MCLLRNYSARTDIMHYTRTGHHMANRLRTEGKLSLTFTVSTQYKTHTEWIEWEGVVCTFLRVYVCVSACVRACTCVSSMVRYTIGFGLPPFDARFARKGALVIIALSSITA